MCMMLYIGSDQSLPLVPGGDATGVFHVGELHQDFAGVAKQFTVGHVRYAGSHEGCGCGFQLGEYPGFEDDDAPAKRKSLRDLAEYIERQLQAGGRIELFACWAGDELAVPEHRRRLTLEDLRSDDFFLLQGEASVVEAPHNKPMQTDGASRRR